ncbi:MAG: DUF1223 domain-containing protein [Verrucomicrobia bacterium]|nr:DUF1223 domain-containing protein [Verrucomicrobiota bacterium]
MVGDLVAEARLRKQRVFPLAFHVDYWDRHGWRDPFSDAAFTKRQYDYGHAFGLSRVYTPQMIVNGAEQFIGSDRALAERAIQSALARPARVALSLRLRPWTGVGPLTAEYEVSPHLTSLLLNFAVVERGLVRQIERGENAGRKWRQDNVVRAFGTVVPTGGGKGIAQITPPKDLVRENASVIAYAQYRHNRAVQGVAAADLVGEAGR